MTTAQLFASCNTYDDRFSCISWSQSTEIIQVSVARANPPTHHGLDWLSCRCISNDPLNCIWCAGISRSIPITELCMCLTIHLAFSPVYGLWVNGYWSSVSNSICLNADDSCCNFFGWTQSQSQCLHWALVRHLRSQHHEYTICFLLYIYISLCI